MCVVRVEGRRVAVGVGERLGQRPLGQPRRLVEHLSHGLAVEVTELAGGQHLLQVEHLEEVELQVTHVALVVAHGRRLSLPDWLRTDGGTMANRGTRLGGPRLVLCEAGACAEVPANTRDTVHRRDRTTGDHRGCSVVAVVVRRFGARGRRRYERCDAQSDQQGTAQAPMLGHRDTRFPRLRAERTTRNRGRAGISRLCARCGSLRSTSPAAGSRTRCMVPVDRSTASARATSAGGRRSFATRARPDFCHRWRFVLVCRRDQIPPKRGSTRTKMLVSAAEVLRERGAAGVTIDEVLARSGAPRGSVYYHFPEGRNQILTEALQFAGEAITAIIDDAAAKGGMSLWSGSSSSSGNARLPRATSPLAAPSSPRRSARPTTIPADHRRRQHLRPLARRAHRAFVADGFDEADAASLAIMCIASLEGAVVLCRSTRSVDPLRDVAGSSNSSSSQGNSCDATAAEQPLSLAPPRANEVAVDGRLGQHPFRADRQHPRARAQRARRIGDDHLVDQARRHELRGHVAAADHPHVLAGGRRHQLADVAPRRRRRTSAPDAPRR